jgi:surfeit locus 1 family protein
MNAPFSCLECLVLRVEFGDCRLVASWWITILTLIGVLLFAQLGRWQWHRAEEKRALAAAFSAGGSEFMTELGHRSLGELPRYTEVRLRGSYEPEHQFLLDNMTHGARAGYQVLTPFRLEDGRLLLVNRGWLPMPGDRRDRLPDVAMTDTGLADIGGRVDILPVAGIASGQVPPTGEAWPQRTSFPSTKQLARALHQDLEPGQVLLAAGEPHGYLRDWQNASLGLPPERHISYAVEWWAFGALSLFLYLFMNMECRRR